MSIAESALAIVPAPPSPEGGAIGVAPATRFAAPELAVVIPTLNERDNVPIVVQRLNRVLAGIAWEAIFVDDDSPDGTADVVRALSGQGFKILLDLFASSPRPLAFAEVPLNFRQRLHGESKLDAMVVWEYLMLLLEKLVGPAVPVRFLLFSLIGGLGVGTHLLTLWFGTHMLSIAFPVAQAVATTVAMTGNFLLNNLFTYHDRRLRGRRLITGLISFYAVCGAGGAANVGVASYVMGGDHSWWLAGLAGAAVSVVWNYAMSSIFTWSPRPAAAPAARPLPQGEVRGAN